jgi:hypothetical protein
LPLLTAAAGGGSATIAHDDALAASVETLATWSYLRSLPEGDPQTPWGGSPWDPWYADPVCMWQLQLDLEPIGDGCTGDGGPHDVPCEFLPQGCSVDPCSTPGIACTSCTLTYVAKMSGCLSQGPAGAVCAVQASSEYIACVDDKCFDDC